MKLTVFRAKEKKFKIKIFLGFVSLSRQNTWKFKLELTMTEVMVVRIFRKSEMRSKVYSIVASRFSYQYAAHRLLGIILRRNSS